MKTSHIASLRRRLAVAGGWLGIAGFALIGLTSCCPCRVKPQPGVSANHAPVLAPLAAEAEGRWVRFAPPGSSVTVRAHATDKDGDALRYRWVTAPDSGKVELVKASVVKWDVGPGSGDKRLYLVVADGKGGYARQTLRLPSASEVVFSGKVVSADGKPIGGATVDVNDQTAVTASDGHFSLPIANGNAPRFVLNIRKTGFGLVSRIYDKSVYDAVWTMNPATVQAFDPTQSIVLRDVASQANCMGSLTSRIDWSHYPRQSVPRLVDTFHQLGGGAVPGEITQALNLIFGGTACSPGTTIIIPPNALAGAGGTPPSGNVDVSVSTADLYAPDSMPGNFTVRTKDGTRWMQSFGAGSAVVQFGGQDLQLKPGAQAEIVIPVDPMQFKVKARIPPTMPFLLYDEKAGEWLPRGEATYDPKRRAYVAKVSHLSFYNADLVKTNQSCIRINGAGLVSSDGIAGKYELDAIIPMAGTAPVVRHWHINPDPDPTHTDPNLHVIPNLPNNTWVTLVPMREEAGAYVPYGIFGINSGPPQVPAEPDIPPYPYLACANEIALTDIGAALDIVVDGTGHTAGPLPAHFYALTDPTGADIYPLGGGSYSLYGLFDTGSTKVRINDLAPPNRIAGPNFGDKDTGHLGLAAITTVNIRINGLNARLPGGGIPMGPPGSASPAQADISSIAVKPEAVDVTLIGAPVANRVVAYIDYTRSVTDAPCCGVSVTGPYIDFFLPGDPGIPAADLNLTLEPFGGTVSTDGATVGQRYWLRNVVFQHGDKVVADHPAAADPIDFLFDTGTTLTIVNNRVAGMLELAPGGGSFNCYGGTRNGYVIDAVTLFGTGGTYRIDHPSICWQESAIMTPTVVDAVIGSNFFDQVQLVVDGPGNRLGIIE